MVRGAVIPFLLLLRNEMNGIADGQVFSNISNTTKPTSKYNNGEPIFVQSYINAYNTAFNQQNQNYQKALYSYLPFISSNTNNNFVPGTFGYDEEYNSQSNLGNSITISYLQDDANYYDETPYLFVSAGSGGGSGFMYLDWVIVTYGVPYVVSVS